MSPAHDEPRRKSALRRRLSELAARCGVRVFAMYFGRRDLTGTLPAADPKIDLTITEAREADLRHLAQLLGHTADDPFARHRASGGVCLIAWAAADPAGYAWINRRQMNLLDLKICDLPDHVGYVTDGYVFPAYRGNKIFQALTCAMYAWLRDRGCRVAGNLVDRANQPSIAARRRLGVTFHPVWILKLPALPPITLGKRHLPKKAPPFHAE